MDTNNTTTTLHPDHDLELIQLSESEFKEKLISSWLQLKVESTSTSSSSATRTEDLDVDEIFKSIQNSSSGANKSTISSASESNQNQQHQDDKYNSIVVDQDIKIKEEPSPWNFESLEPPGENDNYDYYLASTDKVPLPLEAIKTENDEAEEAIKTEEDDEETEEAEDEDDWLPDSDSSDSDNEPKPKPEVFIKSESSDSKVPQNVPESGINPKFHHPCPTCGKIFKNKHYVKDHVVRIHATIKQELKCSSCPKIFAQPKYLRAHEKTHIGTTDTGDEGAKSKPWKCKECPKSFGLRYLLKQHSSIHTGERAFPCTDPQCKKSFRIASDLRRHVARIHSKEKSHKCKICKIAFSAKWDLGRHRKKHL